MMGLSEMSLEDLQKIYELHRTEIAWYRNKLDEVERETREEWERATREYGAERAMYVLGFGPCTGMQGLCTTMIDNCKKTMAEIEAEMERRRQNEKS